MDIKFIGRSFAMNQIIDMFVDPRESSIVNLVGGFGIGKSALIHYLFNQINEGKIEFPERHPPIAFLIQGRSYSDNDIFVNFLEKQLVANFDDELKQHVDNSSLEETLHNITLADHPIVIIIDNFTRILQRLDEGEAQNLNRLRPDGVSYLLVTDNRPIDEIEPELVAVSEFFKAARPIHLKPFSKKSSRGFLEQLNTYAKNKYDLALDGDLLEDIQLMAGGSPALLDNIFEVFLNQYLENDVIEKNRSEIHDRILHFLPEDPSIEYYLSQIINEVKTLSISALENLVNIGLDNFDGYLDSTQQTRLENLGVVFEKQSEINGMLLSYSIITEIIPKDFSDSEEAIFSLLQTTRPSMVTLENMYNQLEKLGNFTARAENEKRRQLDSILARVRKKLSEIPNSSEFVLVNAPRKGYYLNAKTPFNKFYSS